MRPSAALNDALEPRPSKLSPADQIGLCADRPIQTPVSFFLSRGQDFEPSEKDIGSPRKQERNVPVQTLQETIGEGTQLPARKVTSGVGQDAWDTQRGQSAIKASGVQQSRRASLIHGATPSIAPDDHSLTALSRPSREPSPPNSPKSGSSRSLHKSEEESSSDENNSQAIVSSEDDDSELASAVQDSAPQLIMPSIKMPSRRPFTQRGKSMGRCKILVAGCKGSGKTSLIKSIVQVCEDIVHVDPLTSSNPSLRSNSDSSNQVITEIHASTKPYPAWWSDIDESKILRRRKSMGDAVLERNVCFVEAGETERINTIIYYLEQQLQRAIHATMFSSSDFAGMLSGRGGTQVDVILYLVSHETYQTDLNRIKQLSELANVIPLISKSDLHSPEENSDLKTHSQLPSVLPKLPAFTPSSMSPTSSTSDSSMLSLSVNATSPYTISALPGPDTETMEASLLMSPDYVQPLHHSELSLLISELFEPSVLAFLRHTAAKKLIAWQANHPQLTCEPSPSSPSLRYSTTSGLNSPMLGSSITNSGVLVPGPHSHSELSSLSPSTSYALARVADHTQREERLAQVRLSKWAADLQISLQRERERYKRIARGDRAVWLVERMGEEVREGRAGLEEQRAVVRYRRDRDEEREMVYAMHDPLGLLRWQDTMRTRGWIALQVVGSFGVVGGLAMWLARTMYFGQAVGEWAEGWRIW